MAKPRIFVSSTYYDLKYVRERLERIISNYCCEPILFESDEVFFNPNTAIDESCYNEIQHCHMMILIVGGRYGSMASTQIEEYENKYISITQREHETARKRGIPVMVFVEQNVYSEYKTYLANKDNNTIKYTHVDDVRVFQFISKLEQGAIKVFSKIDDIEHYFSHQIAGMLLTYLNSLQEEKNKEEVKDAVDEIKVVSQSMQKMVNSIAEKILTDGDKYKDLLRQQNHALIDFFVEMLDQNMKSNLFSIKVNADNIGNIESSIYSILKKTIFDKENLDNACQKESPHGQYKAIEELQKQATDQIAQLPEGINLAINIVRIRKQLIQTIDLISTQNELQEYFKESIYDLIEKRLLFPIEFYKDLEKHRWDK